MELEISPTSTTPKDQAVETTMDTRRTSPVSVQDAAVHSPHPPAAERNRRPMMRARARTCHGRKERGRRSERCPGPDGVASEEEDEADGAAATPGSARAGGGAGPCADGTACTDARSMVACAR